VLSPPRRHLAPKIEHAADALNGVARGLTREGFRDPAVIGSQGFVRVPRRLLEAREALGLRPADLLVLIGLESHRYGSDREVFPSVRRLCAQTGLGRRTIFDSLNRLEAAGAIVRKTRRTAGGLQTTSVYETPFMALTEQPANVVPLRRPRRKMAEEFDWRSHPLIK
jgi:hypothetical protein